MAEQKTLIATFEDYSSALAAARELEQNGVSTEAVHIDSNRRTAGAGSNVTYEDHRNEGGFSGWWHSLFGSDTNNDDRTAYEGALDSGRAILRATVPEDYASRLTDVLNRNGAIDIHSDRTSGNYDSSIRGEDTSARATNERGPINVVQEELEVGKRQVQRGGVRVYSHVVSEPVEERVNLREEKVTVDRRPVNRELSPEEVSRMRDQTIEVTETAEEPVVAKRARVTEEVVIGKEATERTETIRDNVRHTEVEVENLGRETVRTDNSGRDIPVSGSGTRATGLSPNSPTPGAMSGFGSTAGAGTLAGETTAGSRERDLTSEYGQRNERPFGSDTDSMAASPAFAYGSRWASDERYRNRSWDDVESDLRTDYERTNPGSTWAKVKADVRAGWDKVTGRR